MKYAIAVVLALFFALPVLAEPKRGRVAFDDLGVGPPRRPNHNHVHKTQRVTVDGLAWLHALIARTVDTGTMPTATEESKARGVLSQLLAQLSSSNPDRDLSKQKELIQQLNFKSALLERQQYRRTSLDSSFIVADSCGCTVASNSIIFAKGLARCTSMDNCIVVSSEVHFTSARSGDLLIAKDVLHGTVADGISQRHSPPILIAGSRIRLTSANNVLYWVTDPENDVPIEATHAGKFGRAGASNILPDLGFIPSN